MTSLQEERFEAAVLGNRLLRLREAAGQVCAAAQRAKKRFASEAINWGDLGCVSAEHYRTDGGAAGYRVWIEESSPSASGLQAFIRERLNLAGFADVEVMTEW